MLRRPNAFTMENTEATEIFKGFLRALREAYMQGAVHSVVKSGKVID